VVVWGFGRHGGGLAAARACAERGAEVAILDAQPASAFGPEAAAWTWLVGDGSHPGLQDCDLVVASPAIPPRAWPVTHPPATCPEGLFFAWHQGKRAAVTGTKGKSTTARILGGLLGWEVAGNSYEPLLGFLARCGPTAPVVCELSSFQCWYLAEQRPRLDAALLTLLTSDHLDWHPDLAHYRAAKLAMLGWAGAVAATAQAVELLPAGLPLLPVGSPPAADALRIPGPHNRANAALAIAVASHLGAPPDEISARLRAVEPLPHRLCTVHRSGGIAFVDDSIATTPEAAIAALASFDGPIAIILGGSDKGARYAGLAAAVRARGASPVLLGATAPAIAGELAGIGIAAPVARDLDEAVRLAGLVLPAHGTVLLSPACASFDMFRGFDHRGDCFATAARRLFPA
jgi:UDP-N-acetylmuramoylalanine-D-glutamate ligase